jgi:1-acyl-sn-glycerol-3-phosphate acyltransferase
VTDVDTTLAGGSWLSRAFYQLARGVCVGFCRVWFRMTVEGLEHVPRSGPFVLAPVHRSNMDTPIVCVVTRRRLRYMGKDSLWKKSFPRWFLSALGGFPVTRGSADKEALVRCIAVLKNGEPLVLFPEGERKSGPLVQPLFDGAAFVAAKANAPIVPVGVGGSEHVMPKGSKLIYPRKVHLIVGPPIVVPGADRGRVPRAVLAEVTTTLHDELQRLFDAAEARTAGGKARTVTSGGSGGAER